MGSSHVPEPWVTSERDAVGSAQAGAGACAATSKPVVASGGVTTLDDIRALMTLVPLGVEGAIAGTALYEGRFTIEEALALTRGT